MAYCIISTEMLVLEFYVRIQKNLHAFIVGKNSAFLEINGKQVSDDEKGEIVSIWIPFSVRLFYKQWHWRRLNRLIKDITYRVKLWKQITCQWGQVLRYLLVSYILTLYLLLSRITIPKILISSCSKELLGIWRWLPN